MSNNYEYDNNNHSHIRYLYDYIKNIEARVETLESENKNLKQKLSSFSSIYKQKNAKMDILDYLNNDIDETTKPPITFCEWIENLNYKKYIENIFQNDLLTGIIDLLENGVNLSNIKNTYSSYNPMYNSISIIDSQYLPLRAYNQKQNLFYYYEIDTNDGKLKWMLLTNDDLNGWLNYIAQKFLVEFKNWFKENENSIKTIERMSEKYVEYLQKTLGGQKMTNEGRNNRIKQHIFKNIKQNL